MKKLVSVLILFVFLSGCKTPQKVVTETSQNEKKDIAKDITALDNSQLYEAISRGVQTAINEKLQLSLNQKIYDTDKPVDPGTGFAPDGHALAGRHGQAHAGQHAKRLVTARVGLRQTDGTEDCAGTLNIGRRTLNIQSAGRMRLGGRPHVIPGFRSSKFDVQRSKFSSVHSLRNASTGLRRAARQAGTKPASVAARIENTTMINTSFAAV